MRDKKSRYQRSPSQKSQRTYQTVEQQLQKSRTPLKIGDFYLTQNQYLMIMSKLPKQFSLQPPKNDKKQRKLLSQINERPTKREMKERKQDDKFRKERLKRESSKMTIISNESGDLEGQQSIATVSHIESPRSQQDQQHLKIVSIDRDKEKDDLNPVEPSAKDFSDQLPPQNVQNMQQTSLPNDEVSPLQGQSQILKQEKQPLSYILQQCKSSKETTVLKRGRKSKPKQRHSEPKPIYEYSVDQNSQKMLTSNPLSLCENTQIYERIFAKEWQILRSLKRHSLIGPFMHRVDERRDRAPGYYAAIKHPMDLSTIENKLKQQAYADVKDFYCDVEQIWKNSILYNKPGCSMRKVTAELQRFYEGLKNANNYKVELCKRGRII